MFLGREIIKIDVTNDSRIMRERGHGCITFLSLLKTLCTRLSDVRNHQ